MLGSQPRALCPLLRPRVPWRPVLGPGQRAEAPLPAVSASLKPERRGPRGERDLSTLPRLRGARRLIFLELESPLQNQDLVPLLPPQHLLPHDLPTPWSHGPHPPARAESREGL